MKKLSIYLSIAAVLAVCVAFAGNSRSWPFSAPTVNGSGSVNNPQQGNIIFDVLSGTAGLFKGYDGSSWITLGGSGGGGNPVGTIIAFAGDLANIPAGYLPCDGSPQSRITYVDLFNVIGEAWGEGDGTNTFNLPDLRGRFMRGVDDGAGNDPDAGTRTASNTGGNTGDSVGSVQSDSFQGHRHKLDTGTANAGLATVATAANRSSPTPGNTSDFFPATIAGTIIADAVNGTPRVSSETRPKNVYVNYIIKY